MPSEFKLKGDYRKLLQAIDPKIVRPVLKKNVKIANTRIGAFGMKSVRMAIKESKFIENAELTSAIKGSSKALVDKGDLWGAVTFRHASDNAVFIGILQTDGRYNIAKSLHEGVKIPVTQKMRGLFMALAKASVGEIPISKLSDRAQQLFERMPKGWKPLRESTKVIIIPPRPFLREALSQASMMTYAKKQWQTALAVTYRELTKGSASGSGE
jgi:hypothetical protein